VVGISSLVRAGVVAAGIAAGIATVLLARGHPDLSLAGDSSGASALQLAAGWGLIVAGVALAARRSTRRSGPLLVAAGFAWFAVEAANPEVGSPLVFTAGLLLAVACPALVAHAALAHSERRAHIDIAVIGAGYAVCLGVFGIATTVLNDPRAHGCLGCPDNLAYITGSTETADDVGRLALRLVCGWAIAAVVLIAWRIARSTTALRRRAAPVLVPAAAYLALVAYQCAHGISRGFLSNDPTDRRLWAAQGVALLGVAGGSAWERLRSARMRSELADLVVELGAMPAGRGVRDALARALGEPDLTLTYRSLSGDHWIDADGRPVEPPRAGAVTELAGDDGAVAVVGHRPGVLGDRALVREIARAALPALEHERLQAELKAQLAELRASRARIVAAGDAERRRLEGDLHDGAQQRIVALALDVRLARRQLARVTPEFDDELAAAEEDVRLAVAELREVAHGLHPHTLQESGLAAGLTALAEGEPRLTLAELPAERSATAAEFAAYQVVAETLRRVPDGEIEVRSSRAGDRLVLEVEADDEPAPVISLEDRIFALDGRLTIDRRGGRTTLRAELPCE